MTVMPHWPLEEVKRIASKPGGLCVAVRDTKDHFGGRSEALKAARRVIDKLTPGDFAHSRQLTWDKADVYGVRLRDSGWYLKLCIDSDDAGPDGKQVVVISFHPLDRGIRTNGGKVEP